MPFAKDIDKRHTDMISLKIAFGDQEANVGERK